MKTLLTSIGFSVSLMMAGSASAFTIGSIEGIGGVDVGGVDTLLGQTGDLNANPSGSCSGGSPVSELCWVNNVLVDLGYSATTYDGSDKVEDQGYSLIDGSSTLIGFKLSFDSEYFLIKNSTWTGLFRNTTELGWAVFDTADLNSGFNLPDLDELEISHAAPLGGTVSVPEPGTLALLGLGLAAMGARRKFRSA
jgi:hypothetical protein